VTEHEPGRRASCYLDQVATEQQDGDEAPDVLKGYGYEEKDNDGDVDPFDELLDAYQALVRRGMGDLADEAMVLVHELQAVMLGKSRDLSKGHEMGYSNPVGCLASAYQALVMYPNLADLARKVLALMDKVAEAMYRPEGGTDEMGEDGDQVADGGPDDNAGDVDRGRGVVQRVIQEEDGQFCVYSETGRSFGCYADRASAQARLAQIEQFATAVVREVPVAELVAWHDKSHQVSPVTPAMKDAHDIVCDELEVVHGLAVPYGDTTDDKLAAVSVPNSMVVAKANDEHRYTLGPAYVPDREDAHGEWTDPDTLQAAMWDWVRKGDRTIYLQHSDKAAGEMVELLTWPFPIEATLEVPEQGVTKYTFPANTPYLGVIWEDWAWDMVKAGQLRGYSIGGTARRVEADLPYDATL
jgi:hypothetical protein